MKFTLRDGEVSVGISCVVASIGSQAAIGDKVSVYDGEPHSRVDFKCPFGLLMIQFGPDAVGYLRVAVTDSGAGLSEEEQRIIFGEFTQFNKKVPLSFFSMVRPLRSSLGSGIDST